MAPVNESLHVVSKKVKTSDHVPRKSLTDMVEL